MDTDSEPQAVLAVYIALAMHIVPAVVAAKIAAALRRRKADRLIALPHRLSQQPVAAAVLQTARSRPLTAGEVLSTFRRKLRQCSLTGLRGVCEMGANSGMQRDLPLYR